jgi:two-component system phosphate regulon sensor histidine kinase PhoR
MFDTKNLSPRQLAAINGGAIAIVGSIANLIFIRIWWIPLATFIMLFLIAYILTFLFMQRFIYRKIKLIYKFIYQTKATRREEFYYKNVLPQKSIDEVRIDVENWAEQRKQEIENLKQNEHFRKEFLQNLSHEFKTPVFAIQGYVDTLLNGALEQPGINRRFLENTSRNVERLTNLISDLDEISSLESGEYKLVKSDFVIQDLIREVYDALSLKAQQKNIHFNFKKGCENPVTVRADKEKIRQVLINLIDNAIKYGKQDGHIEASIYVVDERSVLTEIRDDGIGIAEEHRNRIFERFYRTDYGRSRNIGGTGLGLAICKHIIDAHNQLIHVRSNPDVGSSFGFSLSRPS